MPGVSGLHHLLLWTARLLQSYLVFCTMARSEIQQMDYFTVKSVDWGHQHSNQNSYHWAEVIQVTMSSFIKG